MFTGLECNQDGTPEILRVHFTVHPENGDVNTVFTFDATQSTTPNQQIIHYKWDFNNDAIIEINGDDTKTIVTHQYIEEGTYIVKLIIRDDQNDIASTTRAVVVGDGSSCYNDFHKPCPDDQPTVTLAGRAYKTVKVGDQCWFAENLNVGEMISSNDNDPADNGKIEKFCYDNDPANCENYGGIYTWYEMMDYKDTPGTTGICPVGWHIPTQADWDELANAIGGYPVAGRKMMSCENDAWTIEDLATNESGFTAYPGGRFWVGDFELIGWQTNYWTSEFSTLYNSEKAFYRSLRREQKELIGFGTDETGGPWLWHKWWGAYVRCVKDE